MKQCEEHGKIHICAGRACRYVVIEHNLGKQPSVAAFDESHITLIGIVTYVDENKLIIKFSQPISGTAVLN